jgi:hypothetical protein
MSRCLMEHNGMNRNQSVTVVSLGGCEELRERRKVGSCLLYLHHIHICMPLLKEVSHRVEKERARGEEIANNIVCTHARSLAWTFYTLK